MNMPLVLLNRRRRGFTAFSPSTLFALAEPGVWFDPSDLTTLFTDPAGTTPVTTPGNTVGLMLDKSQGLALGAELVANGDFSGGTTGWSVTGGTQAVVSGALVVTPSPSIVVHSSQSFATVIGRTYQVRGSILAGTSTFFAIRKGDGATGGANQVTLRSSVGELVGVFTATATTSFVILQANDSGSATFDNISVRELAGNHATQATLAARPTYSIEPVGGRRNILEQTESLSNAYWTKTSITLTSGIADPVGGTGAWTLAATAANDTVSKSVGVINNIVISCYIKRRTGSGAVALWNGTGYSTISVTGEWARVQVSQAALTAGYFDIRLSVSGDAVDLAFPQVETGSTATAYQRVTTQHDVTEAGVASVGYLYFDGTDDAMATSTITPGTDKAQVFAGVRKLSNASRGILVEFSSVYSNPGSFGIDAPNNALNNYAFVSTGTFDQAAIASPFSAPITNVLTGLGDISGDTSTIRINGAQAAQNTGNQGTGNYLAYPLYIGARGGSSLPFTGHLYSLITRFGPNLDAPTIASTEVWVGDKTGIDIAKITSTTIYTRSGETILDRANSTIERRAV